MSPGILTLLWLGLSTFLAPGNPMTGNEALGRWERFTLDVEYEELAEVVDVVRAESARGDSEVFRRLMEILKSNTQALPSRAEAAVLACAVADAAQVPTLLSTITTMLRGLGPNGVPVRELYEENGPLIAQFVSNGTKHLVGVMPEDDLLVSFFTEFYLGSWQPGMQSDFLDLMTRCNVSADVRQDTVLRIINHERIRSTVAPETLLNWLSPTSFPELRRLVRAEETPERFHFAAADALSYHGDTEIVPDLVALQPVFRAKHPNVEAYLTRFIWRIEVQHPPSKLLEYIASPEPRGPGRYRRAWAVRRAHTLGLEPEAIRHAILQHADRTATLGERLELPQLKALGFELGILKDGDLADVQIRHSKRTP